jgi:hypothetical protein
MGHPGAGPVMRVGLLGVAALCICITAAEAETVEIDFTSSRGSGFFDVDLTNFVVPASAGQPTSFSVIAADININAGSGLVAQSTTPSTTFLRQAVRPENVPWFSASLKLIPFRRTT